MYIHITFVVKCSSFPISCISYSGPEEGQVARAKVLTDDLLVVVRQEHAKVQAQLQQQQMELHQAQAQYAAYSAMGVRRTPFIPHAYSSMLTSLPGLCTTTAVCTSAATSSWGRSTTTAFRYACRRCCCSIRRCWTSCSF